MLSHNPLDNVSDPKKRRTTLRCSGDGDTCGVIIIIIDNGHGDMSSNPRWTCLHFT